MRLVVITVVVAAISSCKPLKNGATAETKGSNMTATLSFPAVVPIVVQAPGGQGACTGTQISPRIVLTAGHCAISGGAIYSNEVDGIKPSIRLIYPDWQAANATKGNPQPYLHDLTLLGFDESFANRPTVNRSRIAFASIGERRPSVGSDVLLTGYGAQDNEGLGRSNGGKTCGRNKIDRFFEDSKQPLSAGMLIIRGDARVVGNIPGTNSQAAHGDSGGPVFADGELVATVSNGQTAGTHMDETQYVDLSQPENKSFIENFLFLGVQLAMDSGAILAMLPAGPADKAGLRIGDVIVSFGTEKKALHNFDRVTWSSVLRASDHIALKLKREGKEVVIDVALDKTAINGEARKQSRNDNDINNCRVSLQAGSIDELGLALEKVVIYSLKEDLFSVTIVEQKSPAAAAGIRVGDVINKINDKPLTTIEAIAIDIKESVSRKQPVKVSIFRRGEMQSDVTQAQYIPPGTRFGAKVGSCPNGGVCIIEVIRNTVASRTTLWPGDRLKTFNNQTVNDIADYGKAVDEAPLEEDFEIVFERETRTEKTTARLTNPKIDFVAPGNATGAGRDVADTGPTEVLVTPRGVNGAR